jgi:hypothetical protein
VILGLKRGLLPGLPVRQATSAQASPEVSSARFGLLPCMTILTESIQALMAVKRAYSELGDAAAAALTAAMAQESEPSDNSEPEVMRSPDDRLN